MKRWLLPLACLLLCLLTACAAQSGLQGAYSAVNPPVESGEMVIRDLDFAGNSVTMVSGEVRQTVPYTVADGTLTLKTAYGDFSFVFTQNADGSLLIDGGTYQKHP